MSLSLLPELLFDFGHAPELEFDPDYFDKQFEREQQRAYDSATDEDLELMSTLMGNAHGFGYEEFKTDETGFTLNLTTLEDEYGADRVVRIFVPTTYDNAAVFNIVRRQRIGGLKATFIVPEDVDHQDNEVYFKPESYGYYKTKFGVYRPEGYDFSQDVISKFTDGEFVRYYHRYLEGAEQYIYNEFIDSPKKSNFGFGPVMLLGGLLLLLNK